MAESVLKEVIEQVVQITNNKSNETKFGDKNLHLEVKKINAKLIRASGSCNIKGIVKEAKENLNEVKSVFAEIDKMPEVDSESDPDDDILTSENSDVLTTEDEAEDFLRHVLRESNGSDLDEESENFVVSIEGNKDVGERFTEKSLKVVSAVAKLVDIPITTSSDNHLGQTNTDKFGVDKSKTSELLHVFEHEPNKLFCNSSTVNVKGCVNKDSVPKSTSNINSSSYQTISSNSDNLKAYADNNNNISNTCWKNMFDDTSVLKYDWSNCYKSSGTDNRDMCTPDAEVESISPELCCIMQLSPDAIYGKDHTIGYQRLYSRQLPHTARPASTLNTPDPICFGDTDSNEPDMPLLRKHGVGESETQLPSLSEMDINNNVSTNVVSKGTKRKLADVDNQRGVAPSSDVLTNNVVTSLMNQGRPPDISTWRAVSPSSDSKSSCINDDITGQWNKPTCTVPPFQNNGHTTNSSPNRTSQQQRMYTARVYNPSESPSVASMTQQAYNQYNLSDRMPRSSCQFTANQTRNLDDNRCQLYNNFLQNTAAYKIDLSSPIKMGAPGMLNFVSHPSYLGVDLTRPRAVYANNLQSMNLNSAYSSGLRYSSCFNTGQFRNFHQPQSEVPKSLSFQIPYINHLDNASQIPRNQPSATQTFAESQTNNCNGTKFENTQKNNRAWKVEEKTNEIQMTKSAENSRNREVICTDSNLTKNVNTNAVACEECDLISNIVVGERQEDLQDIDKDDKVKIIEKPNKYTVSVYEQYSYNKDEIETENKAIPSKEFDSTAIDLAVDTVEEGKIDEVNDLEDDAGSPTPALAYPQVQNKYFSEIYLQKCKSNSPITSFCTALDLSKKEEKKESKRTLRPAVPPKIRPYGEPSIPLSAVLNSVQAPTLAYSGAMLVPYMNSIFAAMAKTQTTPLYSQVGSVASAIGNTALAKTSQNSQCISPLTHTDNLTLNQQVLMYSNFLPEGATSACSKNASNSQNTSTMTTGAAQVPTVNVNVNSIPLPLYATPLQYPIRPLVSVVNPAANTQGHQNIVSPYLYRLNIGQPIQTTTDKNNNTNPTTVGSNVITSSSSSSISSKPRKATTKSKKTRLETTQRKRTEHEGSTGVAKWKQSQGMPVPFNNASLPPFRRNIAAVDGLTMSIQGSTFTATKPTQSRGLTTYQPVPDGRVYRSSDQKKKTFKAKHFPFCYLQIGAFEYTCGLNCNDKVARVKFLFSKRVMVYEFQLENPDGTAGVCKDMVEIEIPFSSIISLWLYDKDMRVEVKDAPKSCLGKKGPEKNMKYKFFNAAVYDRKLRLDITNGQLCSAPYHYVQFKNCCADRLKAELREFDDRFVMMLRLPLIEDPSKSLRPGTKQLSSQLLDPSICLPDDNVNNNLEYQPELDREFSLLVSCSCTNGCSAESCQCCVKGTTCSEGTCVCVNCRNPLNILHQLGLPAERARTDPCLMENIYQIKRLDCYVKTQLVLECCHIPVLLFSCIPGEVRCVGDISCSARYKYSWCTARLLNEDCTPRNHCVKCGTCTDYRNVHCQRCNICYFAGESRTAKCPVCKINGKGTLGNDFSID